MKVYCINCYWDSGELFFCHNSKKIRIDTYYERELLELPKCEMNKNNDCKYYITKKEYKQKRKEEKQKKKVK